MKLKLFSLSIRAQIIFMTFATIILVQTAIFYAVSYLKGGFIEQIVTTQVSNSINVIRTSVLLLPPSRRAEFVRHASNGKWSLWTRELPQETQILCNSKLECRIIPNPTDQFGTNRSPRPNMLEQVFPNLGDFNFFFDDSHQTRDHYFSHSRDSSDSNTLTPLDKIPLNFRQDLVKLIKAINASLDDGTRVGLSQSGNIPILYISLQPQINPYNNTLIKEWLVIPIEDIEPPNISLVYMLWIGLTSILLLGSGWYAWRITAPLTKLTHAADRLGKGESTKVVPTGPLEIKLLGLHFNKMVQALDQAKTVQHTMLAGLPHDLKGPLARMRLRIEMLENEPLRKGMLNDVQEMQSIIEQFITYVRGADPSRYSFIDLNLNQWIDERVNAWHETSHDIVLGEMPKEPLMVKGDTLALARLIDNLISNSLKHGAPPVEISLKREGKKAVIHVLDHGQGIPEDRREEAVQAFSRLDSARTKTGSVGLGLALVNAIVNAHKGELELAEAPQGGLLVKIYLPLI